MKDKGFAAAPGTHTLVGINQFRVCTTCSPVMLVQGCTDWIKGFAAAPGTHTLVGINQFRVRTRSITLSWDFLQIWKIDFLLRGRPFLHTFFPKRTISVVRGWVFGLVTGCVCDLWWWVSELWQWVNYPFLLFFDIWWCVYDPCLWVYMLWWWIKEVCWWV